MKRLLASVLGTGSRRARIKGRSVQRPRYRPLVEALEDRRLLAPVLINFDDVPDGTVINNRYASAGVTFTNPIGGNIYARNGSGFAPSSPNVVSVFATGFPDFRAFHGAVQAQFATPQSTVSIAARPVSTFEPLGTPQNRPFLEAFNASGGLLGRVLYQGPLPTGVREVGPTETLTFSSPSHNISSVRFSSLQSLPGPPISGLFDNLRFERTGPFLVSNTSDAGLGSFRQALLSANAQPGPDTIAFNVPGTGVQTIGLQSALPAISDAVTIAGPGANNLTVRRNSPAPFRIFTVASGVTATISGLTIANGNDAQGGGIHNLGTLTVSQCILTNNSAGSGGGIFNISTGLLTVSNSTLFGNSAGGGGGGIWNGGTLTVSTSTLSGNSAASHGGGIESYSTLTVSHSTLAGNHASTAGGIFNGGPLNLRNTIIAANSAAVSPDVHGSLGTQAFNLLGGNPRLGPLQNNGGPTPTLLPLPGSPALDAGDPAFVPPPGTDQRGFARVVGGRIDIGAVEVQPGTATSFVLTAPAGATAGTPFAITVRARDAYGHTATGYTGTVTFAASDPLGGSLPAGYTFTPADGGVRDFPVTLFTAGPQTITVTGGAITATASLTVSPGPLASFAISPESGAVSAGTGFTMSVSALDAYGNIVTNYAGTVTFATSDPSGGSLPADYTFTPGDAGVATFPVTLFTAGPQTLTVTDLADGSITATADITINPGSLAFFSLYPDSGAVTAGTPFSVLVFALDAYGNVVTDYTGEIGFSSPDPAAVLPAPYTFQLSDAGVAYLADGVIFTTPGPQELFVFDMATGLVIGYGLFEVSA